VTSHEPKAVVRSSGSDLDAVDDLAGDGEAPTAPGKGSGGTILASARHAPVARSPRQELPPMCFDLDSRPPIAPIAGGALDAEEVVLRARDGGRFAGLLARAETPTGAAIIVLPDIRGLHPYYEELALRFAEVGIDALAIDYFGRTAGIGVRERAADFDFRSHVGETRFASLSWDVEAAAERLRSLGPARGRAVFTIGFCFGGRLALLANTLGLDLAGAIGFYGWPVGGRFDIPAPADSTALMAAPVLAVFGGADQGIPADDVETFEAALGAAGVAHEVITYPGAPHSFFDRKAEDFAEASADAWDRVLGFIRANTPAAS
jgi:carboxymethylenebutenolidase